MYILTKTKRLINNKYIATYGFKIKDSKDIKYNDLSTDYKKVKNFVDTLNAQDAELCHIPFLVEEFLEK